MRLNRKAMEIGINMVVMMIIGIVIFALGFGLFGKIAGSSEDQLEDLQSQIKNNIASLECEGDSWVCAPSYKMKMGERSQFNIVVANRDDEAKDFSIEIEGEVVENGVKIAKDGCGEIKIAYLDSEIKIERGYSQNFPIIVYTSEVYKKCSFLTAINLITDGAGNGEKTILNLRVE